MEIVLTDDEMRAIVQMGLERLDSRVRIRGLEVMSISKDSGGDTYIKLEPHAKQLAPSKEQKQ